MIMISSSNIAMHLKTLMTSLCCSDTLNQRNTNVYLVYYRQTHQLLLYITLFRTISSIFSYDCMGFYAVCSHTSAELGFKRNFFWLQNSPECL